MQSFYCDSGGNPKEGEEYNVNQSVVSVYFENANNGNFHSERQDDGEKISEASDSAIWRYKNFED